jgi:hypothetical protein
VIVFYTTPVDVAYPKHTTPRSEIYTTPFIHQRALDADP